MGFPLFILKREVLVLSELENALSGLIAPLLSKRGCHIDLLSYKRKGKENILTIYVERDDFSSMTLDDICLISDEISKKLDEADLIQDNYSLDVSTSGAEKEIKDLSYLPKLIDRYFEMRLINPVDGENIYYGYLKEVNGETITLTYRVKTREKTVQIETSNIAKAKLTVKI